jgi:hypothetical protein
MKRTNCQIGNPILPGQLGIEGARKLRKSNAPKMKKDLNLSMQVLEFVARQSRIEIGTESVRFCVPGTTENRRDELPEMVEAPSCTRIYDKSARR